MSTAYTAAWDAYLDSGRTLPKPDVDQLPDRESDSAGPGGDGLQGYREGPSRLCDEDKGQVHAALDVPPGLQLEDQELRQLGLPLPHTRARGKRHDAAVCSRAIERTFRKYLRGGSTSDPPPSFSLPI